MSSFIDSLIHRSTGTSPIVLPRLRGRFERDAVYESPIGGEEGNATAETAAGPEIAQRAESGADHAQQNDRTNLSLPESSIDPTGRPEADMRPRRSGADQQWNSNLARHRSYDRINEDQASPLASRLPENAGPADDLPGPLEAASTIRPAWGSDRSAPDVEPAPQSVWQRRSASGLNTFVTPSSAMSAPDGTAPEMASGLGLDDQVRPAFARNPTAFDESGAAMPGLSKSGKDAAPEIHISIGRIDLRVATTSAPAQAKRSPERAGILSLEDFLHKK